MLFWRKRRHETSGSRNSRHKGVFAPRSCSAESSFVKACPVKVLAIWVAGKYFSSLALGSRVEPLGKSKNALRLSCNTKIRQRRKALSKLETWDFLEKRFLGLLVLCYLGKYFFKYNFCYLYLNILLENIAMLRIFVLLILIIIINYMNVSEYN